MEELALTMIQMSQFFATVKCVKSPVYCPGNLKFIFFLLKMGASPFLVSL